MTETSARQVALELLNAVDQKDAYANLLLPKLQTKAGLNTRDAAFAQELAFGTLRNRIFYDAVIANGANRAVETIDAEPLNLLRMGAHQLLGMRVPSHAAIHETVELSKFALRAGLSGFVNGVLRRVAERTRDEWLSILISDISDPLEKLALEYSHPLWIVKALADSLRADSQEDSLEALLREDNAAPEVNLVALPGMTTVDELLAKSVSQRGLSPIGVSLEGGDPWQIDEVAAGKARVQDQGSQIAALLLSEVELQTKSKQEEWIDLCAGPGGKAALLAALAKQRKAELTCNELQEHRSKLVKQALKRIDPDVYIRTGDGRDLGEDAPEAFDRILLDAPCSGLGASRRRPESRYRRSSSDVGALSKLQQELFESAWMGLKPGGVIAYVTCSPHLAETTGLVDWVTRKYPESLLIDAQQVLSRINPELTSGLQSVNTTRKTIQLWPHRQQTDAMFIALIAKPAQ